MDIKLLFDTATSDSHSGLPAIILVSVKAQGLTAHVEDISTHSLLLQADLLATDGVAVYK